MESPDSDQLEQPKVRGPWLTGFLILMFITNPLSALSWFVSPGAMMQLYPDLTFGIAYSMGSLAILNIILVIGVWMWKKWGFYGFCVSAAIAVVLNLYIGLGIAGSLSGLLGVAIVFFLIGKRWHHFS